MKSYGIQKPTNYDAFSREETIERGSLVYILRWSTFPLPTDIHILHTSV